MATRRAAPWSLGWTVGPQGRGPAAEGQPAAGSRPALCSQRQLLGSAKGGG